MIDCKKCETCEHWQLCDMTIGFCRLPHRADTMAEDVCSEWAPKHGEWISMNTAWPNEGEVVTVVLVVFDDERYETVSYEIITQVKFGHFGYLFCDPEEIPEHSRVLFWMRHPKQPGVAAIMQEMKKHDSLRGYL